MTINDLCIGCKPHEYCAAGKALPGGTLDVAPGEVASRMLNLMLVYPLIANRHNTRRVSAVRITIESTRKVMPTRRSGFSNATGPTAQSSNLRPRVMRHPLLAREYHRALGTEGVCLRRLMRSRHRFEQAVRRKQDKSTGPRYLTQP